MALGLSTLLPTFYKVSQILSYGYLLSVTDIRHESRMGLKTTRLAVSSNNDAVRNITRQGIVKMWDLCGDMQKPFVTPMQLVLQSKEMVVVHLYISTNEWVYKISCEIHSPMRLAESQNPSC